ncbi:MAG: hypothetical protein AB1599_07745 [Planctomycetota bacterium]
MQQIGFKTRMIAPYFTEIPSEIKAKWVDGAKKAAGKTYKGLKKAVRSKKDFDEKIGEPVKKTLASFFNPEFVSKHGLTYDDIMNKANESLADAGKRYFKSRERVYETGKYEEKLELGQREYARKWCKYIGPLRGYKNGHILGLAAMAIMALTGVSGLVSYLRERRVKFEGQPINVTITEKLNQFRRKLDSRLVHWGSEIITQDYDVETINKANEEINQLVNEYRREDIAQFTSGGLSHIDVIIEAIPNPTKPGERVKQLGLDVQVSEKFTFTPLESPTSNS